MKVIVYPFLLTLFAGMNLPSDGPQVGLNVGNRAPELIVNGPDEKPLALSSLRGKIVLLEFWASWCGPCRMENPNLVRTYHHYKDAKFKKAKGFTIYSVSLDNSKERWLNAIRQDGLSWENHVSDLGAWASQPARTYQVTFIPANFLLDADGIIIAKNLRGAALAQALEQLLAGNSGSKKAAETDMYMGK